MLNVQEENISSYSAAAKLVLKILETQTCLIKKII